MIILFESSLQEDASCTVCNQSGACRSVSRLSR